MTRSLVLALALLVTMTAAAPAADQHEAARQRMVATQMEARGIKDQRVLAALRAVPRHRFVPPERLALAYADQPLPIGFGQTISQPYIVAYMTEALALKGDERVLEVGAGSGYQAAVLTQVAREVYAVEIIPELAEQAQTRLAELRYPVKLRCADGYHGWPEAAPFQAVIVTCAAGHIPPPLLQQLAPGGRMIIPVGQPMMVQDLILAAKDSAGRVTTRSLLAVRFVPLVRR